MIAEKSRCSSPCKPAAIRRSKYVVHPSFNQKCSAEAFDTRFPVEPSGDYRLVYNNGAPVEMWTRGTPVNGTASHALDYDDVNMAILGHPTVAVLPGLLALAEQIDATPQDVIMAFVVGYDVVCRTGALMRPGHYQHGFHATATIGSVGAAEE